MNIFSKILCAIDFSEHSLRVLQWTQLLEKRFGSRVVLLHVRRNPSSYLFVPDLKVGDEDTLSIPAMMEFQQHLKRAGVEYEALLSTGFASDKILQVSVDLNATMIVMGTRGLTGAKRAILGSIAEEVVRNSKIPILTIPPGVSAVTVPETPSVLLPVSSVETMPSSAAALRMIVRELNASLHLIHVVRCDDETLDNRFSADQPGCAHENDEIMKAALRIASEITGKLDPAQVILRHGDAGEEILKQIAEARDDLVLMPVKRDNLLKRFTLSTSDRVISHSNIPVLTIAIDPPDSHSVDIALDERSKQVQT